MTVILDPDKIDHYSLFTTLSEKYGNFVSLNPSKVVWDFDSVLLSLEKPLSVKYIDKEVFNQIKEAGIAEADLRELSRQKFLDEF
jgi:hypothetical protein